MWALMTGRWEWETVDYIWERKVMSRERQG